MNQPSPGSGTEFPGLAQPLPFFFILSRPRTGSTLLRTLLDAHPNIAIPPECQFIINLYPRYGRVEHWIPEIIEDFIRDLSRQHLLETWNLDFQSLRDTLRALPDPMNYKDICRQVYLHYESVYPKGPVSWIGDKNPGYALQIPTLLKLFPEARFIHLVRDYRDNHISLADSGFELPLPAYTVAKWRHFYRTIEYHARRHPEQFYTLRYEDLVEHPEASLGAICDFLDLPRHPSMLDFFKQKQDFIEHHADARFFQYHQRLLAPVDTDRKDLWRDRLSERAVRHADFAAGRDAERAGYQRRFERASMLTIIGALPGLILARLNYGGIAVANALPWRLRQAVLIRLVARIEALWRGVFGRSGKR